MPTAEVSRVSSSPRTIIELNIKHFRDLLKTETAPTKRRTIADLLAEQEAQLLRLSNKSKNAADD
jgi:hypothetical protein